MREGESAINKYYFYNQKEPFSLKNKLERSNVTDLAQRFSDFLLAYFISSLFFFFFWSMPGPGIQCEPQQWPSLCSDNAGSLTRYTTRELRFCFLLL